MHHQNNSFVCSAY